MARQGACGPLPPAVSITESVSKRAEALNYGCAPTENLPENGLCMLVRRKVEDPCRAPVDIWEICLIIIGSSNVVKDVLADCFKQRACCSYGAFRVGFAALQRFLPSRYHVGGIYFC